MPVLSTTDKCLNDKVFRLKTKIENRYNYFEGAVMHSELYTDQATLTKLYEIQQKTTHLINRLDKYKLYTNTKDYKEVYDVVKKWSDRKTHLYEQFGIEQSSNFNANPVLQKVFKEFEESAKQSSYACASDRLKLEIIDKRYRNWFIVFSTLTVDPQNYEEVFTKGSQAWRTYIRTIQRKVAKSCYGSYRKAKGKEYFSYFAVIEEGSKTQRLHIHVLMFMKDIFDCQDPNSGRRIPNRQEIKELNQYWKYGLQAHIAVRFGGNDAYAKKNWRYPVDNDGNPIRVSTIGAVAGYLTKYIIKSKEVQLKGEITSWKIKVSKTLGKLRIQEALQTMSNRELLALIAPRKYPRPIQLHGQKMSSKTIRRLAVKESLKRDPNQEVLPKDTHIKTLCRSTIGKGKCVRRSPSFGNILMRIMSNEVTYDVEEFYNASKTLKLAFSELSAYTEVVGARLDEQR